MDWQKVVEQLAFRAGGSMMESAQADKAGDTCTDPDAQLRWRLMASEKRATANILMSLSLALVEGLKP